MSRILIKPKRPTESGWQQLPSFSLYGFHVEGYSHESGLMVTSAVEVADDDLPEKVGPEYHIGISWNGKRCSAEQAQWVLKQFGMEGAEEDNHQPNGIVRNFWKPVAEKYIGIECPCKEDEHVIRENDYEWRPLK